MGNASKAFFIAGSVLVGVLILSFAVKLYNEAADVSHRTGVQLSGKEISQYNQRFSAYTGEEITGKDVSTLIKSIQQHNNNDEETAIYGKIKISGTYNTIKKIDTLDNYSVEIISYNTQGAISEISINKS